MRIKLLLIAILIAISAAAWHPLSNIASDVVSCSTTPTAITLDGKGADGWSSVSCQNPSGTAVYFGPSTVAVSGTSAHGFPICTDSASCGGAVISMDARSGELYCRVASGTQDIYCIAGD